MSTDMFGQNVAPRPTEKLSRDAARTERQRNMIAIGRHPFGRTLADNGKTCGECWFAVAYEQRKTWWKCERTAMTHGANTDLRLSWPACDLYAATKPEHYETTVPAWVKRKVAS